LAILALEAMAAPGNQAVELKVSVTEFTPVTGGEESKTSLVLPKNLFPKTKFSAGAKRIEITAEVSRQFIIRPNNPV